jgi:hypothetical protein
VPERLVESLGVARDPSRNPLFQVAFAMRESDAGELALDDATVRRSQPSRSRNSTSRCPSSTRPMA